MSRDLDTIKGVYASFARGDIPAVLARMREDVDWDADTIDHGVPWLRPRKGRDAAAEFFRAIGDLEYSRFDIRGFLEGDGYVAVVVWVEATAKSTGKHMRDLGVHLYTFDGEGRIASFRHFVDTWQHVQIAGVEGAAKTIDATTLRSYMA